MPDNLPQHPPAGKTRYKATYRDPKQNPFSVRVMVPTKMDDVDSNIPIEEVERLAREGQGSFEFVKVEIVERS